MDCFADKMPIKLYSVSDSPPAMAVKMTLVALNVPHTVIPVDFMKGEHRTDEYAQVFKVTQKPHSYIHHDFCVIFRKILKKRFQCWRTTVSSSVRGIPD
jgi:hypothetical protein